LRTKRSETWRALDHDPRRAARIGDRNDDLNGAPPGERFGANLDRQIVQRRRRRVARIDDNAETMSAGCGSVQDTRNLQHIAGVRRRRRSPAGASAHQPMQHVADSPDIVVGDAAVERTVFRARQQIDLWKAYRQ
jgi:hypothetical protein